MKILYITTKATYGGVQTHIKQCAEYMQKSGHVVGVVSHPTMDLNLGMESELDKIGVTFFANKFLRNSYNPLWGLLAMCEIRKVIVIFRPDIVSCHSSAAGLWGRLAVFNKVPVIFTAHGWGFSPEINLFQRTVVRIAEKFSAFFCKKIICVSEYDRYLAERYKITNPSKLITVHNGVENDLLNRPFNQSIYYKKDGRMPVVFIGRLSDPKKPEQLLQAIARIPKDVLDKINVYIIGEGEKRVVLDSFIRLNKLEDRVHILGQLNRSDIFDFLSSCVKDKNFNGGIFTLLSQHEGLPRAILEGMTFGFAILASNVGGVKEEVDSKVGVLIPGDNLPYLVKSLTFLISNPSETLKLGVNAKFRAKHDFSLKEMCQKTEEIYKLSVL